VVADRSLFVVFRKKVLYLRWVKNPSRSSIPSFPEPLNRLVIAKWRGQLISSECKCAQVRQATTLPEAFENFSGGKVDLVVLHLRVKAQST